MPTTQAWDPTALRAFWDHQGEHGGLPGIVTMGYVSSAMENPTSSLGKRSLFSARRKPTMDTRTHTQTDCTGARAGVDP